MLMSNLFSPRIFFRMFVVFFIFEILLIVALVVAYYFELDMTKDQVKKVVEENNLEVMNSFNVLMKNKINKFKLDLLLIGKHLKLIQNTLSNEKNAFKIKKDSLFFKNYDTVDCLADFDTLVADYDYKNIIPDQTNPMRSMVQKAKYFDSTQAKTNEEIIKELVRLPLLNKMSFFNAKKDEIKDISKFCFLKSVMKTILIKNILEERGFLYLNNFFILYGDIVFQYPPNNTTFTSIKSLPEYSKTITSCESEYTNRCMTESFEEYINFYKMDTQEVIYFHRLNEKLQTLSCLQFEKKNYVCIQNDLTMFLNQFNNRTFNNSEITSISPDDNNDLSVLFALNANLSTFKSLYEKEILGDLKYNAYPSLFHLLYYDIFKYKEDEVDQELIDALKEEYTEIKAKIFEKIGELSKEQNITLTVEVTFIDADYNISGILDYSKKK